MQSKKMRRHPAGTIAFACLLAWSLASAGSASAFDSHREGYHGHRYFCNHERVIRSPARYREIRVGALRYYHHHGTFYRRGPAGFVVVRAPVGAVVLGLPIGCTSLVIGGSTFYTYGNVYYQRIPAGYVVVEPPPRVVVRTPRVTVLPPDALDGQVSVLAERLNVRSGPGLNHEVIAQVPRGEVLTVKGTASGWWYVELPGGQSGWVMTRFTTDPRLSPASG